MTRRDALKQTALLTGYALSASAIAGVLNGCQPTGAPDWTPQFFSVEQGKMLGDMAETMLPKTEDSPGAKDVFVHEFIDLMVKDWYKEKDRQNFVAGLDAMAASCQEVYGKAFSDCSPEQQLELMNKMDQEMKIVVEARDEDHSEDAPPMPFMHQFKQLALMGYFSSEKVGLEVLAYDPIPGGYNGCMPLEEQGNKNWSL